MRETLLPFSPPLIGEEEIAEVIDRECLEAPCRANHFQEVGSAFRAPPVDAVVHRH